MSESTDGQIFYGILVDEGAELPWEDEVFSGDIEDWWLSVNEYFPPFEIYTEEGEYREGISGFQDEKVQVYYKSEDEFLENHPLPIEVVNVCSLNYPIYAIAIAKTVLTANRGEPVGFDPKDLKEDENMKYILLDFVKKYKIECSSIPRWFLSSYWG
jgi:hypothetical protein